MRRSATLTLGWLLLLESANAGAEALPRPKLDWEYSTGASLAQSVVEDKLGRPYLYAAIKEGGLLVLDISGGEPTEAAAIPPSGLGGLEAMNLTQQGDRVYLGAMDHGVFIFEISKDGELRPRSKILPDVDFPRTSPGSAQHPNARGLAVHGDQLYVANDAGGLRIIDVSDPSSPVEIGMYLNPEMLDKQAAYNNVVIDWPYAHVAVDYCGLETIDVTDPSDMHRVGWWNPWSCDEPTNLWFNSPGHTNQIIFDPDKGRVYMSAGDSELRVVNVRRPARSKLRSRYGKPQNGQAAWGVGLTDDTIYLTYIRAIVPFQGTWSGIRALKRRRN